MSKNFIEKRFNSNALDDAARQQRQLSYFTTSEVQKDIRIDYFENFVERKYYNNDVFLNWVKQILKDKNFLSFAKYYRNPNPASKLVNTRIKEPLSRVFFSEDAHFNYIINNKPVEHPKELDDKFEQRLFNALIFNHNDVIVHDLSDVNKPYRKFVPIDKVVSIETNIGDIVRVAYTASAVVDGEEVLGYAYLDAEKYEFYSKDLDILITEPHDYGMCPATFVVDDNFYQEGDERDPNGVVKQSIFSHVRSDFEEYVFLKVLQKITDTNGAFPVYVKLKTKEISEEGNDFDGVANEPMGIRQIGGQVAQEARRGSGTNGGGVLQAGTEITAPVIFKDDGSVDVELAKNFITFYHAPVEVLKFMDERIKAVENNIIISTIGDFSDRNDVSMTEMQAAKGFVSRDDKLRWVSNALSFSRQNSDNMMLSLAYGRENVKSDVFYGSDFFLETPSKLYEMFEKAPNSIERKNILVRLSQRRNMFNKEKQKREVVLYKLLPYTSDKDFDYANDKEAFMTDITFEFQTRFNYWIAMFESFYGDICTFWNETKGNESEKIILLNNLILNLIQTTNGKETSS